MMNEPSSDGVELPLATNEGKRPAVSPSPREPTAAQQVPSPPSAEGRVKSLPFHVTIADGGLEIEARVTNEADLENLIRLLQTVKPLLRNIYGGLLSPLADPPDPPDFREETQRVLEPSKTAHQKTESGISFIITRDQKAGLRRLGYTEEQIREMRPEDAHRALGLIT
jgi:hypothetical protein